MPPRNSYKYFGSYIYGSVEPTVPSADPVWPLLLLLLRLLLRLLPLVAVHTVVRVRIMSIQIYVMLEQPTRTMG